MYEQVAADVQLAGRRAFGHSLPKMSNDKEWNHTDCASLPRYGASRHYGMAFVRSPLRAGGVHCVDEVLMRRCLRDDSRVSEPSLGAYLRSRKSMLWHRSKGGRSSWTGIGSHLLQTELISAVSITSCELPKNRTCDFMTPTLRCNIAPARSDNPPSLPRADRGCVDP